jgi:molecular chaperone DnaJ
VTIPAGLDDGDTLTAEGEGGPGGTGGPPGDLLVVIRVAPHPVFRRDGLDLEVDVPITYLEAVFGVDVEIPSLGGPLTLRLPPGTQGGSAHRLDGRGIAAAGGTGDLVAIAHIAVPTDPDAAERSALAALTPFEPEDLRRDLF